MAVFSCSEVNDIHSVLQVTVYDQDVHSTDFLGRLAIPLLQVRWHSAPEADLILARDALLGVNIVNSLIC